jgi:hypothetical protein
MATTQTFYTQEIGAPSRWHSFLSLSYWIVCSSFNTSRGYFLKYKWKFCSVVDWKMRSETASVSRPCSAMTLCFVEGETYIMAHFKWRMRYLVETVMPCILTCFIRIGVLSGFVQGNDRGLTAQVKCHIITFVFFNSCLQYVMELG